jgi:hypothetical protein
VLGQGEPGPDSARVEGEVRADCSCGSITYSSSVVRERKLEKPRQEIEKALGRSMGLLARGALKGAHTSRAGLHPGHFKVFFLHFPRAILMSSPVSASVQTGGGSPQQTKGQPA